MTYISKWDWRTSSETEQSPLRKHYADKMATSALKQTKIKQGFKLTKYIQTSNPLYLLECHSIKISTFEFLFVAKIAAFIGAFDVNFSPIGPCSTLHCTDRPSVVRDQLSYTGFQLRIPRLARRELDAGLPVHRLLFSRSSSDWTNADFDWKYIGPCVLRVFNHWWSISEWVCPVGSHRLIGA